MTHASRAICLAVLLLLSAAVPTRAADRLKPVKAAADADWQPMEIDLQAWVKACRQRYDALKGYRCFMVRRHRLEGGLTEPQTSRFYFRKPFAVRLTVIHGPAEGVDLLYIKGENKNRIRARGTGFWGFKAWNLKIDSDKAMEGELHPVTEIGIGNMLNAVEDNLARLKQYDGNGVSIWAGKDGERSLMKVEIVAPKGAPVWPKEGFFSERSILVFDVGLRLPVEARAFDDGNLREEYVYYDIEINPRFSASTFDFDDI